MTGCAAGCLCQGPWQYASGPARKQLEYGSKQHGQLRLNNACHRMAKISWVNGPESLRLTIATSTFQAVVSLTSNKSRHVLLTCVTPGSVV